jgi:Stress responsive A/B Barrel Domain
VRKHYIIWQWKEDASAEQIEAAMDKVLSLAGTVEGLIHVRNGRNLSLRLRGGYTHFTEMYFTDQTALERYYDDPSHHAVSSDYTTPIAKRAITLDFDDE